MKLNPVTLTGKVITLVPLNIEHVPELTLAGRDEIIWTFMRYGTIDSEEKMAVFVKNLLSLQELGTDLSFTVIFLNSGKAIGMTRYLNIEPANRALEIGGTWYATEYQRSAVNTECKYLLLKYAFEELKCVRVQFKADLRNNRSQQALERIGAVREGVLRNHIILPDGTIRSSVYFSILLEEWPAVKQKLETMLNLSQR